MRLFVNVWILLRNVFFLYLCVIGLLTLLTGLLHFTNNKPESFQISGLNTNPTLAVMLVAIVLVVNGIVTILVSGFAILHSVQFNNMITENGVACAIWFFILACLSFFMTGIFGLITSLLCLISGGLFAVALVVCHFSCVSDTPTIKTEQDAN
ncbi:hypothetical protein EIN_052530 [Entamoeba invadens IP1]|uniref:hypothetical protein n=1 Tax=Entamoeba invadens IP1 TaxID=370355 RepID=UPI0002C3F766|nr:hypothetical protein EIN_052530 [Entamoeba invadens IP1]ELP93038.1 hypothetical protein EIN_052530 [Entamoeba invadens IP1]|eukprot:XP_004259809.1 hypothetical protein EIN_052530 [Entamoeba invadens IP1]